MQVPSLGWEGPLESEMATHSSILVWKIACIEEPGGLQSMELQRGGHNWSDFACRHSWYPWGSHWWLREQRIYLQRRRPGFSLWLKKIPWRREWLPTPKLLPGESHGQRSLQAVLQSMELQRVRQDWATMHYGIQVLWGFFIAVLFTLRNEGAFNLSQIMSLCP